MKTSTILLSIALAFKTIYSKAIDNTQSVIAEQLSVVKGDDSVEIVKSDNFIYKFHCSVEKEFCNKFKNDMEYAFNKISNAFEFYQPIVFEAYLFDEKYNLGDALGGITDINWVPLKTSNDSTPYLYPQALSKQLKLNMEPDYKKNDFLMVIKNSANIQDRDFRSIFIHELLHGLGFFNNYTINQYEGEEDKGGINYLYPENSYTILPMVISLFNEQLMDNANNIEDYMNQFDNTEWSKFLPLNIFEKYIASLESGEKLFDSLSLYFEEVNQKCLPNDGSSLLVKHTTNQFIKECIEKLNPETLESIDRIIKDYYFKSNSTGFLTKDGEVIPLQTFNYYKSGSSIIHPKNPYEDYYEKEIYNYVGTEKFIDVINGTLLKEITSKYSDENYILYYDYTPFTVEEMMELLPNNEKHPLIGDGIVKVMTTMGWTEKGEKRSNEMYYVDESIYIPENRSYEYSVIKKSKFMPEQDEEEPTITIDEIETANPIDSTDTDIEIIDVEVTSSPDHDSDSESDSDNEDKQF